MEILFKNKTKYTKQIYQKYLEFHQNKFGLKYKFITILVFLLLSFCFIINLKYSNYNTAFVFIIALISFFIYIFFAPTKKYKKN